MTYLLLSPSNWIIILLLVAYFSKNSKWRKRLTIAAAAVFIIFSNKLLHRLIIQQWQPAPVDLTQQKYQTAILLGGLNWTQHGRNGFIRGAADRFHQTHKLYKQGIVKKILISAGGNDTTRKEALFLKQQFTDIGVPGDNIVLEEQATTTYENALYSKRVIDSMSLQGPSVLVTSAIHMPRARRVFEKASIAVVPFPCDYEDTSRRLAFFAYVLPDVEVLLKWAALLKEWTGIVVYKLQGKA